MAQLIVNIEDASLLSQIKKAYSLQKGVSSVKVVKKDTSDISAAKGYQEAMTDVREGRVYKAENADEMFTQILGYVPH